MKKLTTLLLVVALILGMGAAFAESDDTTASLAEAAQAVEAALIEAFGSVNA